MIDIGKVKVQHVGLEKKISFEIADCLHLPYQNGAFDAVTVAFGIRNFANIAQGLQEIHRVLKPGGGVVVTELSTPIQSPFKQLATLYTQVMVRFAGWWLRLDFAACKYLPASIKVMPQGEKMAQLLQSNGFGNVTVDTFTWGVCSCYAGVKIENNDHTKQGLGADTPAKKEKVNKANRPSQNQSL
jgi:demethylmenaquinone methyltransferase/2-methoxy-6-polyprenyl-1,4-benzoquinol methylase